MTNIYNMVLACLLVLASKLLSIRLQLRYHSVITRYPCATFALPLRIINAPFRVHLCLLMDMFYLILFITYNS